jgi:hypothetical protein
MKDTIVMCPTLQRAAMEWNHFCYVYRSMIQRADRNQLKIVLLGGATLYFKAETQGQRGFNADICTIDEFIGKVEKDEKIDS